MGGTDRRRTTEKCSGLQTNGGGHGEYLELVAGRVSARSLGAVRRGEDQSHARRDGNKIRPKPRGSAIVIANLVAAEGAKGRRNIHRQKRTSNPGSRGETERNR